jgi:glycosyltransferase involved in cell wall biosynthesis
MSCLKYALITPARNEENFIENTIKSVIAQTVLPEKWVIVSDGSVDGTDEIIKRYEAIYDFILFLRIDTGKERNFASKIHAFMAGVEKLKGLEYRYLGILDADVTFTHAYYEEVLNKFQSNNKLGVAGGLIFEFFNNRYLPQNTWANSVAGAIQLFRRECFDEVDGIKPLERGGEDSVAEITARSKGWQLRTLSCLKVFHHRRVSAGMGSILAARFRYGITHYLIGYHPMIQALRCFYRIKDKPYFAGSMFTLFGYCWAAVLGYEKAIPVDVERYFRKEQLKRLRSFFLMKEKREKSGIFEDMA